MNITFASSCSGIGSPEVAWHDGLGWKSQFVAEIEPHPCRVLKKRWPLVPNLGDMTKIDGSQWELDVFVAGTPCQSFSFAGLRQGLNDARGNLTLTFVNIAHAIRHLFAAVWENVPGVLSDETNAFGHLLGGLVGANAALLPCAPPQPGRSTDFWRWVIPDKDSGRKPFQCPTWPDAGMVAGPLGRAAWRIFDAQYFGLAQRRRRVFVVFCPTARGGDPSAILFERKGMSGHPKARRQAREDVAGTLSARTDGGGGLGTDFELAGGLQPARQTVSDETSPSLRAQAQASHRLDSMAAIAVFDRQANDSWGEEDIASTVMARDYKSATDLISYGLPDVAHTLRGEGFDASEDGSGRGTPLVPIYFDCKASGQNGFGVSHIPGPLRAMGHSNSHQNGGGHAAVAYSIMPQNSGKDFKARKVDIAQPLMAHGPVSGNQGGDYVLDNPAYSVALRGRDGGATAELGGELAGTLRASQGGGDKAHVLHRMAVRRLTPTECARLQGFPDGHSDVGTPEKPSPDGPMYKSYGNSMAVKVMRFIGERIETDMRRVAANSSEPGLTAV